MIKNNYLDFAIRTSKESGKILLEHFGKKIRINYKGSGKNNLVTEIDEKIEKFIIGQIKKTFPSHCILSEESGDCGEENSKFQWIIDPIDGTTNFAHGYPSCAVSIGLQSKGEMIAGAIFAPVMDEQYWAARGKGAFLNGKKIHVSKIREIETSLLATGFTYHHREINVPNFIHFLNDAQGIRRCGAATLDLCHIAAGRLDGYWEIGLKPWDVAAGSLIVEEAGGKITNLDGSPFKLDNKNLLATNGLLHQTMVSYFKDKPVLKQLLPEAED